ncbi:MCE family protein [Streptomyces gobiensis]|uniref:MCE family protein n=1 Tax=Streptomyces gobiensis TaxID=2875706 RepID=UPI001E615E00|nr:MCE family protein [Streptomyces gobiensis]UGY92264.1 MCE family protein [Streptomyces gobiensis]
MKPSRRHYRAALWLATGTLLLTGCGFNGLHDIPLPGGAAADGDAYRVTVEFQDVLDLVPQSTVKVNNVTVGTVEKIELAGWHARARLRISDSVKLPQNAVAELRQTSILGEKYVALSAPPEAKPKGRLTDGSRIPLSRSSRNAEIEEVLSALSALLNGGGVAQLKTITKELNNTMEGREDRIKSLLKELNTFLGGLDKQRHEIVRAIEGLDKLSKTLAKEKKTIADAVDTIPDGLKVLADQRRNLTKMLTSISKLGTTGSKVINASRADLVANLKHLQPILTQLNKAGSDLPNALELLTTYPFPRGVTDAIKGDFVNLKATADLDLESVYGNMTDDEKSPKTPKTPKKPKNPDIPDPGLPDLPGAPSAPSTPDMPLVTPSPPSDSPGDSGPDSPDLVCPPVCTGTYALYGDGANASYPSGVSMSLADLMTRGLFR